MIEITALRIGNILEYKREPHYVSMLSLDIDDEYTELIGVTPLGKRSGETSDWIRAFEDLSPMKMSEKWLSGFDKSWTFDDRVSMDKVPLYSLDDFNVMLSKGAYWYATRQYDGGTHDPFGLVTELEFVHELQNAFFALNKKELQFK